MKCHNEPRRRRNRVGTVLNLTLAGLALGALVWASAESTWSMRRAHRFDPVTATEVAVSLRRAGLNPEALAAAGFTAAQTASVVSQARNYVAANAQALRSREAAWDADRAEVDRLERLVRSGQQDEQDLSALAAARTRLAASAAGRAAGLDAVHEAGVRDLNAAQRATLTIIRHNQNWELPTQYLAVDRPESEWVALRSALADDRIAAQLGGTPNPAGHQHLLTWAAQADVAAAAAGLSNGLGEVTSAFNQGLTP